MLFSSKVQGRLSIPFYYAIIIFTLLDQCKISRLLNHACKAIQDDSDLVIITLTWKVLVITITPDGS